LSLLPACSSGGSQGDGKACGAAGSNSHREDDGGCACDAGFHWKSDDPDDMRCVSSTPAEVVGGEDAVGDTEVTQGEAAETDSVVHTDVPEVEAITPDQCLVGIPCVTDDDCEAGQHCNTALTPPACEKLYCGTSGSICDEDPLCSPGLFCIQKQCLASAPAPECRSAASIFKACGGDLVGTWKIHSYCWEQETWLGDYMQCSEPVISSGLQNVVDGVIAFHGNGNYESSASSQSGTDELLVDLPCQKASDCPQTESFLKVISGDEWDCPESAIGCTCSRQVTAAEPPSVLGQGTYFAGSTSLDLYRDSGDGYMKQTGHFCREGNILVLELDVVIGNVGVEHWILAQ
jgi:hypothetical protein